MKEITLTAIFEPAEEGGFIGYIAELPGANTQGETLEECRENLAEAVEMILDANRDLANQKLATHSNVTREQVTLRVA
ncbi:MAG: type II toxin-antitoxin system HicB family antitoxin [Acidobacteria bacterium]|nr:type II toxin-antitoxin system HicB family antitoxin [Acidobacteriota bacterium]